MIGTDGPLGMRKILMVSCLLAIPAVAAAQNLGWQKYAVPETGAHVDLPMTIFSKDAGAAGKRIWSAFLTADGRANLTVQSVPNGAGDSPAVFLAKMNPPSNIVYKRVNTTVLRRVQFPQRENLVQPLQLCRAVHALRIDQLPCRREAPMGQRCHADQ